MAIIKAKQKEYHARVPNDTARDKDLSLEAKGLLCVLLSMDEDWKIYKKQITEFSNSKYHTTSKAFNELIEKGYIIDLGRLRDQNGHVKENLYEVHAEKQLLEQIEPNRVLPDQATPRLVRRDISNYTIPYSNSIVENTEKENQEDLNIITETSSGKNSQSDLFGEIPEEPKESEPQVKVMTLRQQVIDFWLKEFHVDWSFSATDGKKINSIINKLKKSLSVTRPNFTEEDVLNLFKTFCLNLPEFYKTKDLSILESKYDTIIEEIKQNKNGQQTRKTAVQSAKEASRNWAQWAKGLGNSSN